jgi:phosphatidylglycerol:prolipoprotein diacylglycerol transferase
LSGIGRFLVEFVRINPKLYFHQTMSNAQVAAVASAIAGVIVLAVAQKMRVPWVPKPTAEPGS